MQRVEKTTYRDALKRITSNMDTPDQAIVRTATQVEKPLSEHLIDLEGAPAGEASYMSEIDDQGIGRITRLDEEGTRTEDKTLVLPSGDTVGWTFND